MATYTTDDMRLHELPHDVVASLFHFLVERDCLALLASCGEMRRTFQIATCYRILRNVRCVDLANDMLHVQKLNRRTSRASTTRDEDAAPHQDVDAGAFLSPLCTTFQTFRCVPSEARGAMPFRLTGKHVFGSVCNVAFAVCGWIACSVSNAHGSSDLVVHRPGALKDVRHRTRCRQVSIFWVGEKLVSCDITGTVIVHAVSSMSGILVALMVVPRVFSVLRCAPNMLAITRERTLFTSVYDIGVPTHTRAAAHRVRPPLRMVTRKLIVSSDAEDVVAIFDHARNDLRVIDPSGTVGCWKVKRACENRPMTPCNFMWNRRLLACHGALSTDNFVALIHLGTGQTSLWNINDTGPARTVACVGNTVVAVSATRVHLLTCTVHNRPVEAPSEQAKKKSTVSSTLQRPSRARRPRSTRGDGASTAYRYRCANS